MNRTLLILLMARWPMIGRRIFFAMKTAQYVKAMMRPITALLIGVFVLPIPMTAHARWKPEYAAYPQDVQDWYRQAELTPAAQQRFMFKKCCDHSDVVNTKFAVDRTTGADVWFYEDTPGHMKKIPADIIHWGESAPSGKPTLFVWEGRETCFYPGDGGI